MKTKVRKKERIVVIILLYELTINPTGLAVIDTQYILYYTPVNTIHVCSWFYETPCVGRIAHFSNSIRPEFPDHMIICKRACVCVHEVCIRSNNVKRRRFKPPPPPECERVYVGVRFAIDIYKQNTSGRKIEWNSNKNVKCLLRTSDTAAHAHVAVSTTSRGKGKKQ